MLRITGSGATRTCDGLTRRDFLQVGTLGAVGLSLADVARAETAAKKAGLKKPGNDKRSCIMIFNLGAPKIQSIVYSARVATEAKPKAQAKIFLETGWAVLALFVDGA